MKKLNLKGLTLTELEEFCISIGTQRYRGKQLFDWLYAKEVATFGEMTSLSRLLQGRLAENAVIDSIRMVDSQTSAGDGTRKYLFELADGARIESVLIPPRTAFIGTEAGREEEQRRLTLCVSTQAGCPLDCRFCATAAMGLVRNLTPGEIIDQVLQVKKDSGRKITNIVFMGMGEPLLNYDNVMKSIGIITNGMDIAARRLTISTAGIVPKIRQMADEGRKVKLAISLHTLDENERTALMPINRKYPVERILEAAGYYYRKTRSRITFEYILFDGRNDRDEDIARLVRLSRKIPCKINVIPFHSIASVRAGGGHPGEPSLRASARERMEQFVSTLREAHVTVFIRSSAGEDIDAACGQLAARGREKRRDRSTMREAIAAR